MESIVILGTGLAGYSLAREIRKLDKTIPLHLITADDGRAYSKPMLSNALSKNKTADQLAMADSGQMADQLNARIDNRSRVERIDRDKKAVLTSKGLVHYSRLVLALGADPVQLPFAGNAGDAVLSINDLKDYALFRKSLKPGARILIMGAGLIGCEFANDLALTGYSVMVVDPSDRALGHSLPEQCARSLARALQAEGVTWRFGVIATRIDTCGSGLSVTLSDDQQLEVDLILSAIGLRPRKALAEQSGLVCNRGIAVNQLLHSSDSDIFALGDCAEICGLVLPFVMPIMHAARALAKTLCGIPTLVTLPAMPVVVKTPSCPLVFVPPPPGWPGGWAVQETSNGIVARYTEPDGGLAGFALTGEETGKKQALAKQLPGVLT